MVHIYFGRSLLFSPNKPKVAMTPVHGISHACSIELQRAIDDLLQEDYRAKLNERRDASRKSFARPLVIEWKSGTRKEVRAFSRDISALGIGVTSNEPFETGTVAKIRVAGQNGESAVLVAECRWCNRYGNDWYTSGWNLLSVERK